jgi:O-antigen/teichoic acid export membrane protein
MESSPPEPGNRKPRRPSIGSVFVRLSALSATTTALGLLTGPLQAHALGPTGRGELAAIVAVGTFLPLIAGLGFEYFVSRQIAAGAPPADVVGTIGLASLVIGLILIPVGFPLAQVLAKSRHVVYIFILAQFITLPLSLCGQVLYSSLIGMERWTRLIIIRFIPALIPAIVIVTLFILQSLTVWAVALTTFVAGLISLVPGLSVLPAVGRLHFRGEILRSAIPFSLKTWLGTLAVVTNGRLDQLLMVSMTSSRQLGLYAVAVTASSATNQLASAVGSPLLTRVAAGERNLVTMALRIVLLTVAATNIIIAATIPILLPLIFGGSFRESVPMALILLLAALPLCATLVLTPAMVADGNPTAPAFGETLTLAITIPGLIILLPILGGIGAAIISLVAYTVDAGYQLTVARSQFGGRRRDYIVPKQSDLQWTRQRLSKVFKRRSTPGAAPAS